MPNAPESPSVRSALSTTKQVLILVPSFGVALLLSPTFFGSSLVIFVAVVAVCVNRGTLTARGLAYSALASLLSCAGLTLAGYQLLEQGRHLFAPPGLILAPEKQHAAILPRDHPIPAFASEESQEGTVFLDAGSEHVNDESDCGGSYRRARDAGATHDAGSAASEGSNAERGAKN
jgi:hypothetical protein